MKRSFVEVSFPDGKKIDAKIGEFTINTDQAIANGGDESAPEPFQLFLASIATCAGIYALSFCQSRNIRPDGMALSMECEWDEDKKRYPKMSIDLRLPEGFDEKYREAVVRSMDLCSVKKHMMDPPEFEITTS
ncbi:MAG: OsmC family protein [Proteobacteria bacterium]|nr:OsmC family protein [Pseudomonadota bacterium]